MKLKANKADMKSKGKHNKKKGLGQMADNSGKKKKKDIADMSVDDMFSMVQDDDSDYGESTLPSIEKPEKNLKKAKKKEKKKKGIKDEKVKNKEEIENLDGLEDDDLESLEGDEEMANASSMSRKEYLEKLKETDPEFYGTLMESTDLLDLTSDEEGDEDEVKNKGKGKSNGTDSLFEAEDGGDESDNEVTASQGQGGNITAEMIAEWEEELRGPTPLNAFMEVQQAFLAAIESLSGEKEKGSSQYIVKGSQNFNAIVRLCLRNMAPALRTIFNLQDAKQLPMKSKKWNKHKNTIKLYLQQLTVLTNSVAEPAIAEAVLSRGVLPIIPFYAGHFKMSKLLARRLVSLWATSEKKVRVLAFMGIFRLTQTLQGEFLEWMLKKMYIAYVQNCRFTSPATWGIIDFMRVSLVELYSLDYARAYRHAFVYIRQMAIHLRNAILVPKKDRVQLVYNWQYIHCLNLWCDLLGKTHPNPSLQPMIFPVTQVAIGTIKLQATPTYFPLAFHVCKMLTELSRNTGTFIPILPLLLEILNKVSASKQPKKSSVRPFKWSCVLRLSQGELRESAFKDGAVDLVYDGMISYLSVESHSIGFPDLAVPVIWQLKLILKKCKSPNYSQKFKQLLDKIRENSDFIESRRKDVKFGIADTKAIRDWEISVKQTGTPLSKYYTSWQKVREQQEKNRRAKKVNAKDYDLPVVKKRELEKGTFASDEEDEEDLVPDGRLPLQDSDSEDGYNKEDEDNDDDDDDYDDDDDDYDDEVADVGPPKKKAKNKETTVESLDMNIPDTGITDVVREMNFSDLDDDDGADNDDYGVSSDS